ncbi:MAG: pyridoxamine 5'-phosphate oxidase family protein, partial [Synergistaceae bacterium]|nr:pyridoxamine 5'-phosphate oxidase family protein [Synergistaceae bacterium]
MLPPVRREGVKTFYWHTNAPSMRIKQYKNNPKACVYFYDKRFFQGANTQVRPRISIYRFRLRQKPSAEKNTTAPAPNP